MRGRKKLPGHVAVACLFWRMLAKIRDHIRRWKRKTAREESLDDWFARLCDYHLPRWQVKVALVTSRDLVERAKDPLYEARSRREIEGDFADNARRELDRLDHELLAMQTRTATIGTVAALLFAIYSFINADVGIARLFLAFALCSASAAIVMTVRPLSPPLRRAWREKYVPRHEWTLLADSPFTRWVLECWLADRRSPVVQRYKKAHSVSIRALEIAAAMALLAIVVTLLIRGGI
jgi:hypothetical protein